MTTFRDPRLTNPLLLLLAGRRVQHRQTHPPPGRKVTLAVVYADQPGEPPMPGYEVTYLLPDGGKEWRVDDGT
jgi:hypothetical protein